jgi:hypothetical protein
MCLSFLQWHNQCYSRNRTAFQDFNNFSTVTSHKHLNHQPLSWNRHSWIQHTHCQSYWALSFMFKTHCYFYSESPRFKSWPGNLLCNSLFNNRPIIRCCVVWATILYNCLTILEFLKMWYTYHQWYASHCSVVHGLNKKNRRIKKVKNSSTNTVT